jgi:hypothetical protein
MAEVDDPSGRRRHSELRPLLAPASIATASTGEGAMGTGRFQVSACESVVSERTSVHPLSMVLVWLI